MQTAGVKGYRLSIQQNRLWYWAREQQSLIQGLVEIDGSIVIERFEQALRQVLDNHAILRTVFYRLPGTEIPVQIVKNPSGMKCQIVSLEGLTDQEQQEWLSAYQHAEQEHGIDLEDGPVMRVLLVRLQPERHALLLCIAGLCADRVTLPLLTEELGRCYSGDWDTEEKPLQHTDVAAWQEALLEEEDAESMQARWDRIDLEQIESMSLPWKGNRNAALPKRPTLKGNVVKVPGEEHWGPQLSQQVEELGVSEQAYLLTCWQVLLWRLTGEQSSLVGITCDDRHYDELAGALGPYSRAVPFMTYFEDNQSLASTLMRVNTALNEAVEEQIYFTWHGEATKQYFPVSYEYEHWADGWQVDGSIWRMQQVIGETEPSCLKLRVTRQGQSLHLHLHYAPQQISEQQALRLSHALSTLLEHSLHAPQTSIGALPLLNEQQRHQQALRFIGETYSWPFQPLHHLFEAWAERTPDTPAVVSGGQALSYRQLNEQANQLAWALRERGVGPNVPIALCLSRGILQLVALLGILKAGATYVPLESDHPAQRLLSILHELDTPLLLTEARIAERLAAWSGEQLLLDHPTSLQGFPSANPAVEIESDDLACIIYTSGSTGLPKGVMIAHHSVSNYTRAISQRLQVLPGWSCATVSTLAADLGNTAIFSALANGGTVHLLPYETVTAAQQMQAYMNHWQIDLLKIVPSHLSALLQAGAGVDVLPRHVLVLGGEQLQWELVKQVKQLGGSCRIWNHYGPTEATVGVLVHEIEDLREQEAESVPLGRALSNCGVCVVDEHGEVVPDGVRGELWITGAGLARGYWQREEQSRERFVERAGGKRWYRTGDVVRINEAGEVEYVGRKDNQVKVRGYRVELAEIEALLLQEEGVREAVVVFREREGGETELIGYVVVSREDITSEAVKRHLQEHLPGYMVPSRIIRVAAFPRTPNGKIDRQRLTTEAAIEQLALLAEDQTRNVCVQPRDTIEHQLLHIWEEVLKRRPISITENFFTLGGHSLLAVRLMSLISEQFGQNLELATLFLYPTVEALAVPLRQQARPGPLSALVPIHPQGTKRPFFCVHPAGGNVFCYSNLARHLGAEQPFYGLQTPEFMVSEKCNIEDMAAHYISAIQTIQPQGPYLLGGWSLGGVVAFEMAQQLQRQGFEIALLAVIDSTVPGGPDETNEPLELDLSDAHLASYVLQHFHLNTPGENFQQLEPEEQLMYALEECKRHTLIPRDTSLEQLRSFGSIHETNIYAARRYVPQVYPHQVDLFLSDNTLEEEATSEDRISREDVRHRQREAWEKLSGGGIIVHPVAGNHQDMVEEPCVRVLSTALAACIERVLG